MVKGRKGCFSQMVIRSLVPFFGVAVAVKGLDSRHPDWMSNSDRVVSALVFCHWQLYSWDGAALQQLNIMGMRW